MRIGLASTLATRVSPVQAGSVESLVWLLARELTRLGHEVTVFACAGSDVPGELMATVPGPYATAGAPADWQLAEWLNLTWGAAATAHLDVLHAHAYLWSVPLEPLARCPLVHTTHVLPDE